MKRLAVAGMISALALIAPQTGSQAFAFSLFGQSARQQVPPSEATVTEVQASNDAVRLQQLEEQVRQLNGRIEDMSYQLLQMQEQMRKTQQDNEFRFQDLEKKRSDAGQSGAAAPAVAARQPSAPTAGTGDSVGQIIGESNTGQAGASANSAQRGNSAPGEMTLGSMQTDSNGNPLGASLNGAPGANGVGNAKPAGTKTASTGGENDLYQVAYSHVLSGDYKAAEGEFKDFITRYPQSGKAADASFWLGEAQYSQQRYKDSAETFLKAYQAYGKTPKAPEMLLKLGMSLAALDNKDTACATLREVGKRYPNASKAVQTKVASEQKRLSCG